MLEFIATLLTCSVASPQSDKSLPGFEPPRELRIAIREQLDPKKFQGMKTYERMARRLEIIQSLMEKFPREVYPAHDLIWYAWYGDLDLLPALQQSLKAREKANASDPVAIRTRLRDETDPAVLQSYETLWAHSPTHSCCHPSRSN